MQLVEQGTIHVYKHQGVYYFILSSGALFVVRRREEPLIGGGQWLPDFFASLEEAEAAIRLKLGIDTSNNMW